MKKLVFLSHLSVLIFTTVAYLQESKITVTPEVGQYCKVYIDNENLQITTVRLGKLENNEALIEIEGIDHPFDKKILKAKVLESNSGTDMSIKYEGKDWVIFSTKNTNGGTNIFTLYLPNKEKKLSEFNIYYSKDLSNQCKSAFLLSTYLEQKK